MRIKEYILLPGDIAGIARILARRIDRWDILGFLLIIIVVFFLRWNFLIGWEPLFFWSFIFAHTYWKIDSRASIALALACLAAIPLMMILYNNNILFAGEIWSERAAVWAFYFLCIGVVKQMFELKHSS